MGIHGHKPGSYKITQNYKPGSYKYHGIFSILYNDIDLCDIHLYQDTNMYNLYIMYFPITVPICKESENHKEHLSLH